MPPLKYSGLCRRPSGPLSHPPTRRVTRYEPPGVTARVQRPSTQKRALFPVDTGMIRYSALPW
jgi:hypothetical protein